MDQSAGRRQPSSSRRLSARKFDLRRQTMRAVGCVGDEFSTVERRPGADAIGQRREARGRRLRRPRSQWSVIIHADAPVIGPYMSRAIATIQAQQSANTTPKPIASQRRSQCRKNPGTARVPTAGTPAAPSEPDGVMSEPRICRDSPPSPALARGPRRALSRSDRESCRWCSAGRCRAQRPSRCEKWRRSCPGKRR